MWCRLKWRTILFSATKANNNKSLRPKPTDGAHDLTTRFKKKYNLSMSYEKRLRDAVQRDIDRFKAKGILPSERMRTSPKRKTVSLDAMGDISSIVSNYIDILGLDYTTTEREVLYSLLDGHTQAQIAESRGVTKQRINEIVASIRAKINESL